MKYIVKSPLASKTMDFPKNKSYIFAHKRLAYIIMEQKKIEHITLNLIVFGTIVIIWCFSPSDRTTLWLG